MGIKHWTLNMQSKLKIIIIAIVCGVLSAAIMIEVALIKDNEIECKIIYDYNQKFEYEPYLFIEGMYQNYEISPHTPLSDTYESAWTWFEESYLIPYDAIPVKNFALELVQNENIANICSIEFYNHGYQAAKFSPAEIKELFIADEANTKLNSTMISFLGNGNDIVLRGSDLFYNEIIKYPNYNVPLYYNSILWGSVISIIIFGALYNKNIAKSGYEKRPFSRNEIIVAFGLVGIFIFTSLMSILSKHYSHPDEPVTRMAIDYYLAGWRRPDMNSSFVAGTISNYGHSRLREGTLYYFIAGKVAWIFREYFHISTYYRMLNLLLLGVMFLFCWKQLKNQKWGMVALCMTPQVWYLYAYATSDAWDWFWGFVTIYLLLQKDIFLYKQIREGEYIGKIVLCSLGYSLVFSMILLGKTNYHVLLGVAFVDFLLGWFQQKRDRVKIFILYLFMLCMSFGLEKGIEQIPRAKPDVSFVVQDENTQKNMKKEQREKYKQYILNGSLKDEGYSFGDMLWHYSSWPTPITLFASSTGCYMWLSLYSGIGYYIVIAIVYSIFLAVILQTAWKNRQCSTLLNIKMISSIIICCLIVIIVLLYCWMKTYQPQGRYLLTIWLILGYICAQYKEVFYNKVMNCTIVIGCIVGCWSFLYYGLYSMFQQGFLLIS